MNLHFLKYHGLGNDFIVSDARQQGWLRGLSEQELSALAQRLCERHTGIGADGWLLVCPSETGRCLMLLLNADGSVGQMCGNGMRCLARYLWEQGEIQPGQWETIETLAWAVKVRIPPGIDTNHFLVTVDMGIPRLNAAAIPTTLPETGGYVSNAEIQIDELGLCVSCANTGVPHTITFVDDIQSFPLEAIGPKVECHPAFPCHTNFNIAQVLSRKHLQMRTWERGAGLTLACGTGACATLVVAHLNGLVERSATLTLPGGDLQIVWDETTNHLLMTGPAEQVFSGVWLLVEG